MLAESFSELLQSMWDGTKKSLRPSTFKVLKMSQIKLYVNRRNSIVLQKTWFIDPRSTHISGCYTAVYGLSSLISRPSPSPTNIKNYTINKEGEGLVRVDT